MSIDIPIPDGERGNWKVSTIEVTEVQAQLHNCNCHGRPVDAGTYKSLSRNGYVIMSNTPMEIYDHLEFIYQAKGDVLINGLGLAMCIFGILEKPEVQSITVIEKEQDVIDLVAPHIKSKKVKVIHCDAFDYQIPKGKKYNAVWHDIWDDLNPDNLTEMTKLKRKYGRHTEWQGCWGEYQCRRRR